MDICKKIWNTTVTVGQIITSAIIALTIGVVLWLLVQMFRPNKKLNFRRKRDTKINCSFQERTLVRQGLFSFKLIAKIAAYIMEGYTHFGILKGELLC